MDQGALEARVLTVRERGRAIVRQGLHRIAVPLKVVRVLEALDPAGSQSPGGTICVGLRAQTRAWGRSLKRVGFANPARRFRAECRRDFWCGWRG